MNYAFGLWEKRCGSYFDTDWFNLHRVKSDSDHPNPTGQIITLHIPFTQEQTDTLTEGQPGPFYTKGLYWISFGQWFRNRKKYCNLTCANTMVKIKLLFRDWTFSSFYFSYNSYESTHWYDSDDVSDISFDTTTSMLFWFFT